MLAQYACFALIAVSVLLCAGALAQPAIPAERTLAREILEELVEIPSTASEGTARAAQMLAGRLAAVGFPKEDIQVLGPDAKTQNLVARFRGSNPRARAVLLLAHIDVVPARREDWSLDPWTFVEREGWYYGRGTSDNKAGAAMLVANLIRLKREGWQPARDIVVLLTGDEETDQNGIKWMLRDHRALIDAEIALNTDGGGIRTRDGVPVFFDVQASEKIYADYQLEVTDAGGHSSLVRSGNPIYTLSAALTRIGEHQFPLHVNDAARIFLERSSYTETGQTAIDMRAVAAVPPDQAAAGRLSRSPVYNAQLRTTCVATRVEAGHANNALPQLARAVVNCRILPGLLGRRGRTGDPAARGRQGEGHRARAACQQPAFAAHAGVAGSSRSARGPALAEAAGHSDDGCRSDRRDVHAQRGHSHLRRLGDQRRSRGRARAREGRARGRRVVPQGGRVLAESHEDIWR